MKQKSDHTVAQCQAVIALTSASVTWEEGGEQDGIYRVNHKSGSRYRGLD